LISFYPPPGMILSNGRNFKINAQIHPRAPKAIHNNHCKGSRPHYATLIAGPANVNNIIYKATIITKIK